MKISKNPPFLVKCPHSAEVKFFKNDIVAYTGQEQLPCFLKNFEHPLCYINNAKLDKVQFDLEIEVQGH